MKPMTTERYIRIHVDNVEVRRARIQRLLTSGAALAVLVTDKEAADVREACLRCQSAADAAEGSDDQAEAYRDLDPAMDEMAHWLGSMVCRPGWTRGLTDGIHAAYQSCVAAFAATGAAEDEYAYRDLAVAAMDAAKTFTEACRYCVALDTYDRTVAFHRCQDLTAACTAAWRRADQGLGSRVLFYRKQAFAEGRTSLMKAGTLVSDFGTEVGRASSSDDSRRAYRRGLGD